MKKKKEIITLIPLENITELIFLIRGQRVMIDKDLADLYDVKTKRLNEQVKRNKKRFPDDFIFKLTKREKDELVANCDRLKSLKYSTSLPYVFTRDGVSMLSSVLNSERSIQVNIQIMRGYNKMTEILSSHVELKKEIKKLEKKTVKS